MYRILQKGELRNVLVVYFLTWLGVFILATLFGSIGERTFLEAVNLFLELLPNPGFIIAIHILFGLILAFFWIIRYFIRIYKKKGLNVMAKQLAFRFLTPLLVVFVTFKTLVFANSNENYAFYWAENVMNTKGESNDFFNVDKMHRGMSVFGWRATNDSVVLDPLIKANVEWIAVIPFIGQEKETSKTVRRPRGENDGYTRRDSTFIKTIKTIHAKGLYVQLKPHIWTRSGWRSNITQNTAEEWDVWFDSYESHILHYARMAELTGTELFCIGTELKTSIKKQPERWKGLIAKIKELYSGQLTYAANWHDEYEYVDFWDDLDFIGIQAYFPLTTNKNPDLETIEKGWVTHIEKLDGLHQRYKRPILFTEVGYRSDASATIKPWEWDSALSILHKKNPMRPSNWLLKPCLNNYGIKNGLQGSIFGSGTIEARQKMHPKIWIFRLALNLQKILLPNGLASPAIKNRKSYCGRYKCICLLFQDKNHGVFFKNGNCTYLS